METGNPSLAAYLRRHGDEAVLVFGNLSDEIQQAAIPTQNHGECMELLSSSVLSLRAHLELKPYSYLWLQVPNEK